MRKRTRDRLLILALAGTCLQPACTTSTGGWVSMEGQHRADKIALSANVPEGWSRWRSDSDITLTKDGMLLQMVRINRTAYGAPYENSGLTIQPGMSPLDASQIIVEDMQANQELRKLDMIDNRPATVADHLGLRIECTYKNEDNLKVREIIYVGLTPDSYVVARCRAPDRHYMEMISGDFERIVDSIELDPPEPESESAVENAG